MSALFAGQTAVVTGAASNIGRAIAVAIAAEGAGVTIFDIDAAGAAGTEERIRSAGGTARTTLVDLARREATDDALRRHLADHGPPDLLVHAAIPSRPETATVAGMSDADWDAVVTVGLEAGLRLGRGIGAAMAAGRITGRILFITSLHAETPRNAPHYSAAKAGLTMVMKELARALGPRGIRVNALAPGYVPIGPRQGEPNGTIPLGRTGRAEEIAAMAVVLLSDRFSAYVTGTTVVVDGGLSLHNWIRPRP